MSIVAMFGIMFVGYICISVIFLIQFGTLDQNKIDNLILKTRCESLLNK